MTQQSIEWAPFKSRPDVTESAIVAASNKMQAGFLNEQPGFLRRELLKLGAGDFVDLVWWESRAAAETAMQAAGSSAACADYFSLMQFDTPPAGSVSGTGILHFAQLATYGG